MRLNIFPDGGVARLRVHGEVVPTCRLLRGLTIDLAALENGALVTACSDDVLLLAQQRHLPGSRPRTRPRAGRPRAAATTATTGSCSASAGAGVVRLAEIDTTNLLFNAPGEARSAGSTRYGAAGDDAAWFDAAAAGRGCSPTPRTASASDARPAVTHARVDIYPDGGLARVRLHGELTEDGERDLVSRWQALS